MQNRLHLYALLLICLPGLLLVGSSCDKFEGNQTVPAYIKIDSIYLQTDYIKQGTAFQNFTDAWVYVDDNLVGAFQLPAEFPVLASGTHKVTIMPGVKKDGVAATRTNYPFCNSVIRNLDLTEGSTLNLGGLETDYMSTTTFVMIENFDGMVMHMDTTNRSAYALKQTLSGWPATFEGGHSGWVEMDSVGTMFECINDQDFDIPFATVFMELNFNTNNPVAVGVFLYGYTSIAQVPVVYLNKTEGQWKKIYIDLTNALNSESGMVKFRVFFNAIQSSGVYHADIRLDNMKLLYRYLGK